MPISAFPTLFIPSWLTISSMGILVGGLILMWGLWRLWIVVGALWLNRQVAGQFESRQFREVLRYYQASLYGKTRADFPGFQPAEKSMGQFFLKTVFRPDYPLQSHFLIFGNPGVGKTTLLMYVFMRCKLAFQKVKLFRLSDPNLFASLEHIGNRADTILLLDGLDEYLKVDEVYKDRMDSLLDHIQGFGRVLITCRNGVFPFGLEAGSRPGALDYVGERHFQVFEKCFLAPLSQTGAIRFMKNRVPIWKIKHRQGVRQMIAEMPEMMRNPLLLRFALSLTAGKRQFRYPFELLETYLLSWIARQSPADLGNDYPRRVWDFLMDISTALLNSDQDSESGISLTSVQAFATHQGLVWHKLNVSDILVTHPDGTCTFRHRYLQAPLLAYAAFNEGLSLQVLESLSEAVQLFREHSWSKFIRARDNEAICEYRTKTRNERRACKEMTLADLEQVSHLYMHNLAGEELRFLRYMQHLEAIWVQSEEDPELVDLLPHLPNAQVTLYHQQTDNIHAFSPVRGTNGNLNSLQRIDPEADFPLETLFPAGFEVIRKKGSRDLLHLFEWDLTNLPDRNCRIHSEEAEKRVYECFLASNELDMFNKAWVCELPDSLLNIRFQHLYKQTMLEDGLREIVRKLVHLYGEDDGHHAAFTDSDLAEVEDGFWRGRRWFWGNTDRYAYPVQLYMKEPGEVNLLVYGLPRAPIGSETREEVW